MSRSDSDVLRIGISCYPTVGGSGIVATEIGLAMARRGHQVHVISTDVPRRLDRCADNVFFHQVRTRDYPVFPQAPYALALASTMASVATYEGLDVLHAHYAVPHATSAWMARQVLGNGSPKVVTTLHGTDITLVGADASYLPITRHSILHSDAVTAPSDFLRRATYEKLDLTPEAVPIEVVPNFVDTRRFRPADGGEAARLTALFGPAAATTPVLVHVSNFRPVKRVDVVVDVFARVAAERPAFLLLIGDGPDRPRVEAELRRHGLHDRARLLGKQDHFEALLRASTAFLLPSESESFGLAALEALSSGVPVVGSDVGGVPEVVRDGETGFLCDPEDVGAMAAKAGALCDDAALRRRMGEAARRDVLTRFDEAPMVDRYEAVYRRVLTDR
ncbi:MAG: N-acetyl-alpha-D-glucosaminyl L-malate synthase BshA [Myxococcales bacterium]|nr:N-acetyl-alpha-D-glucosaminyl L-malate synthase BshA [Myxococcales bacterium]MCB9536567.1 N-acetyl-alpha-D-glucosaminyl L-malate synthase BshA [Myxococcales bacterium]